MEHVVMEEASESDSRDFVTALARGIEVLGACGRRDGGVTLAEAARLTGLSRATVRRSLLTLSAMGYVAADERRFSLTPKVLGLAGGYLRTMPLARRAQPVLDRVSHHLGESCSLATLDGGEIVYVARAETRRILSVDLAVGSRLPAFCTSMGRVLLAGLPEDELLRRLPMLRPEKLTERTVTDPQALRVIFERVRDEGFCLVDQELEPGLRSLAVPVRNAAGGVIAAINVSTQVSRVSVRQLRSAMLPLLQEAARALHLP
jgi:IclR family transcriptional regulator, pca regulon regulatory protein